MKMSRILSQPGSDEMDVLRHEAIHGHSDVVSMPGMEKYLPNLQMGVSAQPPNFSAPRGQYPMDKHFPRVGGRGNLGRFAQRSIVV
jgi:hypothetical protein